MLRLCALSDNGGEGGIRTHETVSRLHAFQACAFDHSATSPQGRATYFKRPASQARRAYASVASYQRTGDGVFLHSAYMLEDNAPEIDRHGPEC